MVWSLVLRSAHFRVILAAFRQYPHLGLISKDADLIGLRWSLGMSLFKELPGEANVHIRNAGSGAGCFLF